MPPGSLVHPAPKLGLLSISGSSGSSHTQSPISRAHSDCCPVSQNHRGEEACTPRTPRSPFYARPISPKQTTEPLETVPIRPRSPPEPVYVPAPHLRRSAYSTPLPRGHSSGLHPYAHVNTTGGPPCTPSPRAIQVHYSSHPGVGSRVENLNSHSHLSLPERNTRSS